MVSQELHSPVSRAEVGRMNSRERLLNIIIALSTFVTSVLGGAFMVGVVIGGFRNDIQMLTQQGKILTTAVDNLRDTATGFSIAVAGLRIEVDNLKHQLEQERQDRLDEERRRNLGRP